MHTHVITYTAHYILTTTNGYLHNHHSASGNAWLYYVCVQRTQSAQGVYRQWQPGVQVEYLHLLVEEEHHHKLQRVSNLLGTVYSS